MPKRKVYRVRNRNKYNKALIQRGSINFWISKTFIQKWHAVGKSGKRGRPQNYADIAIISMLTIKTVFHLPYRATKGFMKSLALFGKLPISIPCYTTLCRRQQTLCVQLPKVNNGGPLNVVVDSTGLKIFGEGEWKVRKHGYSKRRTWRKIHLAIDADSQGIEAMECTTNNIADSQVLPRLLEQIDSPLGYVCGDGAYDAHENYVAIEKRNAKAIIPPRCNGKIKQHANNKSPPLPRDKNIRAIRKQGLKKWKQQSGYHRRSLAETAMFRLKTIFGNQLTSRKFDNQLVEAIIKCRALNFMTELGMPDSYVL